MLIWQTLRGFFLGSRIKLLVSCQQMSFCCSWESSLRKSDGTKSSEPIPLPHFDFRPSTASSSRGRKPSGPSSRGRKPFRPLFTRPETVRPLFTRPETFRPLFTEIFKEEEGEGEEEEREAKAGDCQEEEGE